MEFFYEYRVVWAKFVFSTSGIKKKIFENIIMPYAKEGWELDKIEWISGLMILKREIFIKK